MAADDPPVRTEELSREFRSILAGGFRRRERTAALSGVTFSVERGEVLGLLGPNGAGKSTTLKLLLGLIRPTRGGAWLLGRPAGDRAALARVGYLPEETRLHPFLSARETARFFARVAGLSRAEARAAADRRLEEAGLAEVASRRTGGFSKGMARRLGLACALVGDPELLLLDEPASGLDPLGAADMKARIRTLKAAGKTILLSSHHLGDVAEVCDRVVVLGGGRVAAAGRPEELLEAREGFAVRFSGGPSDLPERVVDLVRREGATVVTAGPPREDLADLFQRLFRKDR